jgi:hypothetical protein
MKTINKFLEDGILCEIDVTVKDLQHIARQVLPRLIPANGRDPVLFRPWRHTGVDRT